MKWVEESETEEEKYIKGNIEKEKENDIESERERQTEIDGE